MSAKLATLLPPGGRRCWPARLLYNGMTDLLQKIFGFHGEKKEKKKKLIAKKKPIER